MYAVSLEIVETLNPELGPLCSSLGRLGEETGILGDSANHGAKMFCL